MRTTEDSKVMTCLFVDDTPGGIIVECSECGAHTESKLDNRYDNPEFCSLCGKELVYPGWASW